LGLKEKEKIGASSNQHSKADDDAVEIDEQEGGLND
jgi:hypothetical protein